MTRSVAAPSPHRSPRVARFSPQTPTTSKAVVHSEAVLLTLVEGRATMWSNGSYRLSQGEVLLIPEGTPHYLVSSEDAVILGVALCASCLSLAEGRLDFLSDAFRAVMLGASARRQLDPAAHAAVVGVLDDLEHELTAREPGYELVVEALLVRLSVAVHRAGTTPVPHGQGPHGQGPHGQGPHGQGPHGQSRSESLSSRALAFISANALEGISLADVAGHVGRSRSHTSETVKRVTGRTVGAWIAGSRLAAARQLMLDTDEAIEGIAFRVGFASRSHFHRVFKRFHGLPPSAWRRAHRRKAPSTPGPTPGRP
ncbi:MAG: AraC family transcriptional regulator [Acidobacteriota bacterium]